MRGPWIAVALLALAVPLARAKGPLCPGGRYVVSGATLTGVPGMPEPDVIAVDGRMVSLQSGCAAAKGRVRGTALGTKVRVKWRSCQGLTGKAVLSALLMEQCQELAGTFVARRAGIARPVRAVMSRCGDGVWDAAGGESCDAGLGPCGSLCNACACPGEATTTTTLFGATTSTTVFGATTSTTASTSTSTMPALPTTSTTSTTLAGPDLRPHAWMSPGSAPAGTNIAVEFTVRNYGTQTATGPWYDYIMMSGDLALGNDTAVAVVQRVASLNASSQYTVLTQAAIPDVPPGTYYLFLHTDGANAVAETNEPNNVGGFVQLVVN
jgi:hypothetical protein